METYFHSVTLDKDKCKGCTNCIKRCPTEAIRVRKGKATIINERCIDCGECLRVCPYHAKKAITDSFDMINNYKYRIAIPAPSIYGQFKNAKSRNSILTALKSLGFDKIYEVAKAAEIVTEASKKLIGEKGLKRPVISAACPAVVRLIQVRFPALIDNLLKLESPMEVAARIVKSEVLKEKKYNSSEIGVFFISPCAAKVTSVKAPYEKEKSSVDGVIAIKDIYLRMLEEIETQVLEEDLEQSGYEGVRWASSGGEGLALGTDRFLAVDGIHNVIKIFEEIENEKLEDVDFVEALSCTGGCLGGPLTVENVFVAKSKLKTFIDLAKENKKGVEEGDSEEYKGLLWTGNVTYKPVLKLDEDMGKAILKLGQLETICEGLPGLDCGACGAPSCRALAEDIVRGIANETDCIFKLREKIRELTARMISLENMLPPVLNNAKEKKEGRETVIVKQTTL